MLSEKSRLAHLVIAALVPEEMALYGNATPKHESAFNKAHPLTFELSRERGVVHEHASLDVAFLPSRGEVRARHERPHAINRDALRVQAAPLSARSGTQRSAVAVELGRRRAEGRAGRLTCPISRTSRDP